MRYAGVTPYDSSFYTYFDHDITNLGYACIVEGCLAPAVREIGVEADGPRGKIADDVFCLCAEHKNEAVDMLAKNIREAERGRP